MAQRVNRALVKHKKNWTIGRARRSSTRPGEWLPYTSDSLSFVCSSLEEVRGEFDDYQESSRELEAELEAQLEQAEGNNKDLLTRVGRLEDENDTLKVIAAQ